MHTHTQNTLHSHLSHIWQTILPQDPKLIIPNIGNFNGCLTECVIGS